MTTINEIITLIFDALLAPSRIHPWLGMVVISLISSVVLLFVFRYTSSQRRIRAVKSQLMAHLLEVFLYRDNLRVVLRAQCRLLRDNCCYLGYALVPLIFMMIPVGLMFIQMEMRYGIRPLQTGEQAIVSVKTQSHTVSLDTITLSAPEGVAIETDALRMPDTNEIAWRIRAKAPGRYTLVVHGDGQEYTKEVVIAQKSGRISTARVEKSFWQQVFHPGEPPLPSDSPITTISLIYPKTDLPLFGWQIHWLWGWLVLTMLFGLLLKGPLRVQI